MLYVVWLCVGMDCLPGAQEYQPLDLVATDPVGTSSIARQRMIRECCVLDHNL